MAIRRCVCLVFAGTHLVTVVCGACYWLPDWYSGQAALLVRWYTTMSGAESNYGFFAPVVGAQHRAKFQLKDGSGSTWWDVFDRASSLEARLRFTGIVEDAFMSGQADEYPEWRKRLVKSWAATMFTRHPRAQSLTIEVQFYDIPTISAYRAGSRPSWKSVYQGHVQRHAAAAQVRADQ